MSTSDIYSSELEHIKHIFPWLIFFCISNKHPSHSIKIHGNNNDDVSKAIYETIIDY